MKVHLVYTKHEDAPGPAKVFLSDAAAMDASDDSMSTVVTQDLTDGQVFADLMRAAKVLALHVPTSERQRPSVVRALQAIKRARKAMQPYYTLAYITKDDKTICDVAWCNNKLDKRAEEGTCWDCLESERKQGISLKKNWLRWDRQMDLESRAEQ